MIQSLRVSAPSSSATVITVPLLDACNVYKVFWIVKTQFLIRIKFSDLYNILLIKILTLSEIVSWPLLVEQWLPQLLKQTLIVFGTT